MYEFLTIRRDGPVEYVTLNRPDVRNAFNDAVVAELHRWADSAGADSSLRVAVLGGAGSVFSAGADAAWMARMAGYSRDENEADARRTTAMLRAIDSLPVGVVGRIQGAALGGGAGLAAICDVVVAEAQAVFGFTEAKLGIVPAMISPFVLRKIGVSAARELFLTGRRFDAATAKAIGLVHAVVSSDGLDAAVQQYVAEFLSSAPSAVAAAKRLIPQVSGRSPHEVADLTAATIAAQRASTEGQEGLRAFLDKRAPGWRPR